MAFTLTPFLRYALIGAPLALVAGVAFGALVTSATTETIVASVDTVQVARSGEAAMPLVLRGVGVEHAPGSCAPYQRQVIETGIEKTVSGVACEEENGFWRIIH